MIAWSSKATRLRGTSHHRSSLWTVVLVSGTSRSSFSWIDRLAFYDFDPYSQALGKLERAHEQDLGDAREMVARRLIDPARAFAYFEEIEPEPFRFPTIDPANFRRRVEEAFASGI